MKRLILPMAVAVLALSATSCKKDYTCTCTVLDQEVVTEYNDLNKAEAETQETACEFGGLCTWAEA